MDYDAELSSAMEQFHYEKGEPVDLKFLADVSHGTRVRSVTVNGEEHQAEPEENGSVYTVRTEAGDTAGVKEFRFSEVLLEGGQTVKGGSYGEDRRPEGHAGGGRIPCGGTDGYGEDESFFYTER